VGENDDGIDQGRVVRHEQNARRSGLSYDPRAVYPYAIPHGKRAPPEKRQ
jgi:hypothetical protein